MQPIENRSPWFPAPLQCFEHTADLKEEGGALRGRPKLSATSSFESAALSQMPVMPCHNKIGLLPRRASELLNAAR